MSALPPPPPPGWGGPGQGIPPLPPPPTTPGRSKKRWLGVGAIAGFLALAGAATFVWLMPTDEEKRDQARADGKVAECEDGSFSAETDFRQTCRDEGGVALWLATYGRCADGQDIALDVEASCERHGGFDALLPADHTPTARPDDVARCRSGVYTAEWSADDVCRGLGGLDEWLATYGSCVDGTVIKMGTEVSCEAHGGFDALLSVGYSPERQPDDVAECADGIYSSQTPFAETCRARGGVSRWLAPFGACVDGTVIRISATATCSGHGGFDALLPADYEPTASPGDIAECEDGTFTANRDLPNTCEGRGGLARWLAPYGECQDGRAVEMAADASCRDHGGFKGLLPPDFEPGPRPGDVARCANDRYSGNTDFAAACASHGGVAEWLARYGRCNDGTVFEMSTTASCADRGGFEALMPRDYAPPTTTTTAAPPPTAPPIAQGPSPGGDCHPSYTPCVPYASDVDCAGGSGNGPAYTGPVTVIGPDVYDLDRDGDGRGCEG